MYETFLWKAKRILQLIKPIDYKSNAYADFDVKNIGKDS